MILKKQTWYVNFVIPPSPTSHICLPRWVSPDYCLVLLREIDWRGLNEKCDHRCLFWFFFSAYCCHMPSFSCSFFPCVWEKSNKQNKIKKVIWCEYHAPGRFIKVNYLTAVKYTLHFLTTTSIHFSCSLIEREEPSESWEKETNWPGQFFLILTQAKKKQKTKLESAATFSMEWHVRGRPGKKISRTGWVYLSGKACCGSRHFVFETDLSQDLLQEGIL